MRAVLKNKKRVELPRNLQVKLDKGFSAKEINTAWRHAIEKINANVENR